MKNKTFPCTGCSACCHFIGKMVSSPERYAPEMQKEIRNFPYPPREDGVCSMLTDDGKCKVYKDRPDLCDVNKTFNNHYKKRMTRKQYYNHNIKECHKIIDQLGFDPALKPKMIK